jgi:N-formylmaleamate deformylase
MLSNWTENDIRIGGNNWHYYRTGDGSKPPLVLVHGFSDNGMCWLETALDLEDGYDIIMPDVLGHGKSDRIILGEDLDLSADLATLIESLNISQPIIAGHSMGAMLTSWVAANNPQLSRALVLEDPPWWFRDPSTSSARRNEENSSLHEFVASLENKSLDQLMNECRLEHPTWSDQVVRHWCEGKKQLDTNFLSTNWFKQMDWQTVVSKIQCPTLVITADPDLGGIVTPALSERIVQLNGLFSIGHIPGVGHHVRFGNYSAYMEVLKPFLFSKN